jgi:predicted nucleic acid-binding protein
LILVDSSVWIDFLRDARTPEAKTLWDLLSDDSTICTTGLIIAEVLAGQPDAKRRHKIMRELRDMPYLPIVDPDDHIAAAELYNNCRAAGMTVRGIADCVIAAACIRSGSVIFTKDRDFAAIAKVAPSLKQY